MVEVFKKVGAFLKRRRGLLCGVAVLCVLLYAVVQYIANGLLYWKSGMWDVEMADFNGNKPAFECLADSAYRYFEEAYATDPNLVSMSMVPIGEEWDMVFHYRDTEETRTQMVPMTQEEKSSRQQVGKALTRKYQGFQGIYVHENRVTFGTNYWYAVVWAKDGKRPTFLSSPDEGGEVAAFPLSFFSRQWYQVTGTPGKFPSFFRD